MRRHHSRSSPASSFEPLEGRRMFSASLHDSLYIGDAADDSVKRFDAQTGEYLGTFVAPTSGGLHGPRGIVFRNPGQLLVVNQNVDQPFAGEVLRYNGKTGTFLDKTVPSSDPNAPFAPRGMVIKDNVLYVADVLGADSPVGRIARYNVNSGKFLGNLTAEGYDGLFNPRGVVFGPDGGLYVSVFDVTNPAAGSVLRFNVDTGAFNVVATNDGDGIDEAGETSNLHRPEGLVFGPDQQLYVTSFQANASDIDRVLVFNSATGAQTGDIELDQVGQPRAFGQAIEFGPDGKLFIPISSGPEAGSVRVYDVQSETYNQLVAPGGALGSGWFLTFGQTDPATLAYGSGHGRPAYAPSNVQNADIVHNDNASSDLVADILS